MTSEQAVQDVIKACNDAGIDFMVVGSLSSNYYGIARSTQDADFVVALDPADVRAFVDGLGPAFTLDPQPSFETVTFSPRYLVQIAGLGYTIELFLLRDDEYDGERFRRRVAVDVQGSVTWFPTAEDVIVTKLQWYTIDRRRKDLDDIRSVLTVQGDKLDWSYIEHWCGIHGSLEPLAGVRAAAAKLMGGQR